MFKIRGSILFIYFYLNQILPDVKNVIDRLKKQLEESKPLKKQETKDKDEKK